MSTESITIEQLEQRVNNLYESLVETEDALDDLEDKFNFLRQSFLILNKPPTTIMVDGKMAVMTSTGHYTTQPYSGSDAAEVLPDTNKKVPIL